MVEDWVKQIVEDVFGPQPFKVGDVVRHPDGRRVKIVEGQYWGTHGLSNFWYWREVKANGKLGKKEHGYGWRPVNNRRKKVRPGTAEEAQG